MANGWIEKFFVYVMMLEGEIYCPREEKNKTRHWPNIETPTQGEDKKEWKENERDKEQ